MAGQQEQPARTPNQFLFLALRRRKEALLLLRGREPAGALYLAGYVVECSYKALLAKRSGGQLPAELYVHDLELLRRMVLNHLSNADAPIVQAIPAWTHLTRYHCRVPDPSLVVRFLERADEVRKCLSTYL